MRRSPPLHPSLRVALAVLALAAPGADAGGGSVIAVGARFWQDGPGSGLGGVPHGVDELGRQLAAGDFDGDGYDDLASFDRESSLVLAGGAVRVQWGGPRGLSATHELITDFWPASGLADAEELDEFGGALAAGDFNGDGIDDLAIGIPGEDAALTPPPIAIETFDCGAVLVLFGSPSGITASGVKLLPAFPSDLEGAQFGLALAAADFNGDGFDDLAAAAPQGEVSGRERAGWVAVFSGGSAGLLGGPRFLHQDASDATGAAEDRAETSDRFGAALVAGNFAGNHSGAGGRPVMDLAVGVPGEGHDFLLTSSSGLVQVFRGRATGTALAFDNDRTIVQTEAAAGEAIESGDRFGHALAAGDVDGDGRDELVVGTPGESFTVAGSPLASAGQVSVLYGTAAGLAVDGSGVSFHQEDLGLDESNEAQDFFGGSLAVADFDGDGHVDLVIAAAYEDLRDPAQPFVHIDAGAVFLVPGAAGAIPTPLRRPSLFAQEIAGHPGALDFSDQYGLALAAGDFDGNGHPDLAVGAPGESAATPAGVEIGAGGLYVLAGALFADSFERGDTGDWSVVQP